MTITGRLALLALVALLSTGAPDELPVTKLGDGIHLVAGLLDGNVLVVQGEQGTLLVDGQGAGALELVTAAVGRLDAPPVRWLVNTHFHEDHVGANAHYAAEGAVVLAQKEARLAMGRSGRVEELGYTMRAAPEEAWPTLTFESRLTLHVGSHEVRLIHLPAAHTGGDTLVHLPGANVIHTGDVFEPRAYPFLDLWNGGSVDGLIAAVDRILELADDETALVPGHGPVSDRARLAAYREMLSSLRDRALDALDTGHTAEDFLVMETTRGFDGKWGREEGGRRLAWLFYRGLSGDAPEGR